MSGLHAVPNLLNETPSERYEARMNELLDFVEEWYGAVDLKALRIVLAACYGHLFTDEKPIWLWAVDPPRAFPQSLGRALGRAAFAPTAGQVAFTLNGQQTAEKSLWVLAGMGGIFHRPPAEIETSLRQLAEIERGKHEWHSRGTELDGCQGPEPFVWNGRVTVIATLQKLDSLQRARAGPLWPMVQNTFVNVRFGDNRLNDLPSNELMDKWRDYHPGQKTRRVSGRRELADEYVSRTLGLLIRNLMDADFRVPSTVLSVSFASLSLLAATVRALRGEGFDATLLLEKSIRLGLLHASMMGKPQCDSEDLSLCSKVLHDAIPPKAMEVIRAIPLDGLFGLDHIRKSCGQNRDKSLPVLNSLEASGCLRLSRGEYSRMGKWSKNPDGQWWTVTPEGQILLTGV